MKRIGLYLGIPPEGGGAFQYALSMLDAVLALPPDAYEVCIVCSQPAWADKLASRSCRIDKIIVAKDTTDSFVTTLLRSGFPWSWWRSFFSHFHPLTKRLIDVGCDLWIFPAQEVWTYAIPVPTLGVIHDLMHRYESRFPEVSAFWLYSRRERHYRYLCREAKGVLVDSEVGKRQVVDSYLVPADHIHVLPFVAPAHFQDDRYPPDADERFGLPEQFIFYPAQFWKHKNHLRLLEAFAIARRSAPDLHLVLAGSRKNAYKEVERRIRDLGLRDWVHILGYVPDEYMSLLYKKARALIFPTFFGPTNIPPLEAIVTECPMAVSAIYAMPEQVGRAALFFDPYSIEEITDAIVRLATDDQLCRRLRESSRVQLGLWNQVKFNRRFQKILEAALVK